MTSEDEEEDHNSYDGNVITVMEASNMAQHLWHCRVINKDVLEGVVESTERLHEFNEKSLLTLSVRRPFKLSMLSVRTEYIYTAAFQATSPGGVYLLRYIHTLDKKKVLGLLASGLYH